MDLEEKTEFKVEELGPRLKHLVDIRGRRLNRVAEDIGISTQTIYKITRGEASGMAISTLVRLCEALRSHPDYLLGYSDEPNTARLYTKRIETLKSKLRSISEALEGWHMDAVDPLLADRYRKDPNSLSKTERLMVDP